MNKRILSVGNCAADNMAISRWLNSIVEAEFATAGSASTALEQLKSSNVDLVLVNRILDATGESGLELIQAIKLDSDVSHTTVMLISNLPNAQRDAVARGAVPGFGKSQLRHSEAAATIRAALGV